MAYVIETNNALQPLRAVKHYIDSPTTIRSWVVNKYPETGEFPVPTVCILNGDPLMRKDWDREMKEKDIVNFVAVPGYGATALIIAIVLVVIVIAITLVFMLNQPKMPGETPGSDPVWTVKGQTNEVRLGEPIECCYGRNRLYPSYASRPYFEYRDNDQYQFSLFCLGQGEYDISAVQIGDTLISNYTEVEYEVVPPGDLVTLFPTAVYSASEAGGQTLLASNDPAYVPDGWVGPFPASPSGTVAHRLQVDIVFPKGLYRVTKSGKLDSWSVSFNIEYRSIDNAGAPTGDWVAWNADPYITVVAATQTPQRKSYMKEVFALRYEVRVRRYTFATPATQIGEDLVWDGLRSYLVEEQNFGDVTLLAVIIRATNNLNSSSQQQFNVLATRKLPIRESGGVWSAPQVTRSIVWAMVDVFRSNYGGRIFDDDFFDWDALDDLDAFYIARGESFDWIFRDPVTVWEAARAVARVGRATPLLAGSLLTIVRDSPLTVPVAMFNQENILSDNFEWSIKLWDLDEFDSVRIEYTEPSTGYKQETVLATLPGGTFDHPQDIRFPGIQDRAHAYREGLYILANERYRRENVTFQTGLEGFIPTYGDLIAVAHDVPRWGLGGYVVNAERGSTDSYQLWLSQPVEFVSSVGYSIMLRGSHGEVIGPFDAHETDNGQQVVIYSVEDIDFLLDGKSEPMLFLFGESAQVTKYLRVVIIQPSGTESVEITAVTENSIVHSFDGLTPVALAERPYAPVVPDLPTVTSLTVTQIDAASYIIQAAWTAAFGAQYYVVQTSTDGDNWEEQFLSTRTSIQLQVTPGDLYVRVAGVNKGQGPWVTVNVDVKFIVALTLAGDWDALDWLVSWPAVLGAESYIVKVYDNSASNPVLKRTHPTGELRYAYDWGDALEDGNVVREMLVTVEPVFPPEPDGLAPGTVDATALDLTNEIPSPPMHPDSETSLVEVDQVTYRLFWDVPLEEDLIRLKVWLSDVDGFDPAVDVPVVNELVSAPGSATMPVEAFVVVPLDSFGAHPAQYWRVAFFDVWGTEIDTNVSDQQTIAAYS